MKLTFRQRLFLYVALLFIIVTVGIALFENSRERQFKTEALTEQLEIYTDVIQSQLTLNNDFQISQVENVQNVMPPELRITILDLSGNVLFDNAVENVERLENHIGREEVIDARTTTTNMGSHIRLSESTDIKYLYFAKKYSGNYVRVALPYDIEVRQFIKADNLFLYFLIIIGGVSLFLIHRITHQFGSSIKRLHNFAMQPSDTSINFTDDEIGVIGNKILENYKQIEAHKKNLTLEKQKLLQHIQISEEGICFVSSSGKVEYHNGLFIQYLNQLTDEPKSEAYEVLIDPTFEQLHDFIVHGEDNYFDTQINKHGKIFSLRAIIFEDKSFEIILTDISQQEKTQKLKQEITGNIAHELRTPVTSIRAYLETVLDHELPDDKKEYFIRQAYTQTMTLSEMIKDISIISRVEEAPNSFDLEAVDIRHLLSNLKEEKATALAEKNMKMQWDLPEKCIVKGNLSLLNSIFRNLIENSIRYAGENVVINISVYKEDEKFYYFSFYDTGKGIQNETALNRIFERFYRVHEGRTRDTGGSGLGLSIVKNAVLFHKGMITAKNRKNAGLEFIFNLHK